MTNPTDPPPDDVLRDRSALADLPAPPGLCATCVHLDLMRTKRSVFVRCKLSKHDDRFPRYPPLPVRACAGYEGMDERNPDAPASKGSVSTSDDFSC